MAAILATITHYVSSVLWLSSQPVYLIITIFETNFEAISAIFSAIFACLCYTGKALQLLMHGAYAMIESVVAGFIYSEDVFRYILFGLQHLIRFSVQAVGSICLVLWNFGPVVVTSVWHGVAWCFNSLSAGLDTVFKATTIILPTPQTVLEYLKTGCEFLNKVLGITWSTLLMLAQSLVEFVLWVVSIPMTLVTVISDLLTRSADNLHWIELSVVDARDFLNRKADEMYDDILQIHDKVSTSVIKLICAVFYLPFYIFVLAVVCILVVVIPMKFYTLYRNAMILANSLVGLLHGTLFRSRRRNDTRNSRRLPETVNEEDDLSDEDEDLLLTNLQPRRPAPAPPQHRAMPTAPPEHILSAPQPPSANGHRHPEHQPGSSGERPLHIQRGASSSKQPSSDKTASRLTKQLEEERDRQLCVVCQDNVKNILIFPCKHLCVCIMCVEELTNQPRRSARSCPLCREPIKSYLEVFS